MEPGSKTYRYILINLLFSVIGISAFYAISVWIILSITGSPFLTGLVDSVSSIPLLLGFALLFAGPFTVLAYGGSAIVVASLALLLTMKTAVP